MPHLTRRSVVSGLAAAGVVPLAPTSRAFGLSSEAGLKDHAQRAGMIYGAAVGAENWAVPECRSMYEREARIVTTDLELKFAVLRPAQDVFNFAPADLVVNGARSSGMLVRGHTLIWNENNGDWLNRCSSREVERIFDEHIERVVSRYAGKIHTWDVVNEPFWPDHGELGGYRRGPWYNALGPGYIQRALKRVRSIDKSVKLCVNEANAENDSQWGITTRPCFARLIQQLRHDGTPLDAAGLQCHLQPDWPHDYGRLADYMRNLAASKIDIHVTEFDVNDKTFPAPISERDRAVAAEATSFMDAVLPVPELTMFITWELSDRWSFYYRDAVEKNPLAKRFPRPLPLDVDLQRKPFWAAMTRAFDKRAGA